MITLPRPLLVIMATSFGAYHVLLGSTTIVENHHPVRIVIALALVAVALVLSVSLGETVRMPTWLAGLNVGLTPAIAILVASTLQPDRDNGYATWYIAALGTLLTITAVRRHSVFAWLGLGLLTAQTVLWAGPLAIFTLGLLGDIIWVAAAYLFTRVLARATLDVRQFARAEREAVEWQAAQDAHHFERQVRLTQTSRMALPMLQRIAETEGELTAAERHECRVLEQSIRDEIRGRRLLNDAVRDQVITARRRGAQVQILDDGGVDDIDAADLDPVLDRVAAALASVESERWIIRTAPRGSARAITVVGLSSGGSTASALGLDDDDENVDVWLELDRPTFH